MATKNNTNAPIFDAGMALASRDTADNAGRIRIYLALETAGATAESLAKGDDYRQLRDGYLSAWQGETFAIAFAAAPNGKAIVAGSIVDRLGAKRKESKTREAWQRDLGSKVTKARAGYVAWLAGVATEEGATKEGATKAGQGAARALSERITEDLGKLHKAVTKDRDAEAPTLKGAHTELLAAFQRCLDRVK